MAKKEKKIRQHPFYDRHTILGAIVLMVVAMLMIQIVGALVIAVIFSAITGIKDSQDPSYMTALCMGAILGAVGALALFRAWFSPEYKGAFKGGRRVLFWTLIGLAFVAVILVITLITDSSEIGIPAMVSIATALMAGVTEEVIFRGIGASYLMRQWGEQKKILPVMMVTSLVFGLVHAANMIVGAPLAMTIMQVVNAFAMGCFLCALFLRSGSIIPSMVMHFLYDVVAFLDVTNISQSGAYKATATASMVDRIFQIVISAVFFGLALYLTRPAVQDEIRETWQNKWGKNVG